MNRIRLTREDRKNQTKNRLLAAAQKLVPKKGLAATSVDDIVALAGYTRGALYANFCGKHELFFEVLRRDQEQLTDQFHAMLSNAEPIESFLVRTRNVYQIYCGGDDHFKNWTEARMLGSRDETFRAKLNPLLAERHDLVKQFVEYVYQNAGAPPPQHRPSWRWG